MTSVDQVDSMRVHSAASGSIPSERVGSPAYQRLALGELDDFTQGYVEALLGALDEQRMAHYRARRRQGPPEAVPIRAPFSWLSRDALRQIVADCGAAIKDGYDNTAPAGSTFYAEREEGCEPDFPPLKVVLGDDCKVRFFA